MSIHPQLRVNRGSVGWGGEARRTLFATSYGHNPPPTTPPRLTACGVSPALHLPAVAESPPSLHVLCEEPDLLARHEPVPQVLDGGKLHLVPVFTVNVQEDAEEHQEAAPDVPETRRLGGET